MVCLSLSENLLGETLSFQSVGAPPASASMTVMHPTDLGGLFLLRLGLKPNGLVVPTPPAVSKFGGMAKGKCGDATLGGNSRKQSEMVGSGRGLVPFLRREESRGKGCGGEGRWEGGFVG